MNNTPLLATKAQQATTDDDALLADLETVADGLGDFLRRPEVAHLLRGEGLTVAEGVQRVQLLLLYRHMRDLAASLSGLADEPPGDTP